MYQAIQKQNQLIYGDGDVIVVTGWTPKERVAKRLDSSFYAAIGNLYSATRGINILIRNLLANPQVSKILIIAATREDQNAGSCCCLYDFFEYGFAPGVTDTGQKCWRIRSKTAGYIDKEIPLESLELLRESISVVYSEKMCDDQSLNFPIKKKIRLEPEIYPIIQDLPNTFPAPLYGHRIEGKTIAETWVKILHRIKKTGTVRPTGYGGQWQELIDVMAVVTSEPDEFYFPVPNYLPIGKDFLQNYIPQILSDQPYQDGVKYTYGQRLRSWFGKDQIQQIIDKLKREIDSASAVLSLWDSGSSNNKRLDRKPGDSDHDHGGSPCLNHIWIRVVENELSLTATFRSNDMFGAWVANAMGLRALQRHIRDKIVQDSSYDLKMGPLITISQSAHIYDDCWENVDQVIGSQYTRICRNRRYEDPAGNFVISRESGQILVQHISPNDGELVAEYRGKSAESLCQRIASATPYLQLEHALYLGRMLSVQESMLKEDGDRFI